MHDDELRSAYVRLTETIRSEPVSLELVEATINRRRQLRRGGGLLVAATVAVAGGFVTAQLGQGPVPAAPPAAPADSSGGGAATTRLDCSGSYRLGADLDYLRGATRFDSPSEAALNFVRQHGGGDRQDMVTEASRGDSRAFAFILRDDGTAHTRLRLDRSSRGWLVGAYTACARDNVLTR